MTRTTLAWKIEIFPKNEPIVVFWTHVKGAQKRILKLKDFTSLNNLITNHLVPLLRAELGARANRLQLLETIIFNKPPTKDNTLHWHQDVAYFLLKPNNQIAVWFPLEIVTVERGAMNYAMGSHKQVLWAQPICTHARHLTTRIVLLYPTTRRRRALRQERLK